MDLLTDLEFLRQDNVNLFKEVQSLRQQSNLLRERSEELERRLREYNTISKPGEEKKRVVCFLIICLYHPQILMNTLKEHPRFQGKTSDFAISCIRLSYRYQVSTSLNDGGPSAPILRLNTNVKKKIFLVARLSAYTRVSLMNPKLLLEAPSFKALTYP